MIGTPILTYHDFVDRRDSSSLWFDCTPAELESQLRWLTRHGAHFVTLSQIYDHLIQGKGLPKHAIAITAADGYRGFFTRALPIFQRYGVPVTMFVHTGFVGGAQGRPKMNWAQLEQLDRGGIVSLGSETVTHQDLPTLSTARVLWEMTESKKALEKHLGHRIRFVAYPDGKFDDRSQVAAKQAGYDMAFSEVTRPAEASASPFSVNRYVHTKWRKAWRDAYGT